MPEYEVNWHHRLLCKYLQAFAEGTIKKLMVFMPPRHGKLLPADTPVLTTKGWKNHGELNVGDYVFGDDGKPKAVLGNSGIYDWNVERITFNTGTSILAAKEHLWKLQIEYDDHKGRREMLMETQCIFSKKNRRAPAININQPLDLPSKDYLIDPYLLGCWLGDGLSRQGVLVCGNEDIKHFKQLGEARRVREDSHRILIRGLTTKLKKLNLYMNKHIPINYLLGSYEQRLALLQGLMDTDGYVDSRGNCEFSQKEGQLAKDVYTLIRTLGIKARYKTYKAFLNGKSVGNKIRIGFNPDNTINIFRLNRKLKCLQNKKHKNRVTSKRFYIKDISNSGVVLGNCIQVEGGMYLAGKDLIPTHNSELTSRRLPAYLFGIKPDVKIIGCSYNSTLAKDFNRDVQRIIQDPLYNEIFPNTRLNEKNVSTDSRGAYKKNAHEFQIVGQKGYYRGVGVMGPLTGYDMDIGIIDDPVKDAIDAASIVQREAKWEWYTKVFSSRIENHTQQLITQTRWHEDDLSGRIINRLGAEDWVIVNLPAIKRGQTMAGDPRQMGEPLWANKKSLEQLLEYEAMDPSGFKALYQQDPQPFEGGLVYNNWSIIEDYEFQQVESTYRAYGLDLGYNNPSACLDLKIDFANKKVYIDEVLYRTKLNTPQLVENLRANGVTNYQEVVADSAKPETLSEMESAFKIIPAVKGPNSVYAGILICKQYSFYVTRSSINVISEFKGYQWITDASGNSTEVPLKVNDHAMDALRYGVVHADTLFKGRINNERVGFFVNRSRRK